MWVLLLALVLLGYLSWEQARLRRWQRAVPLRIVVTGTRGKSTVVRLLGSALRESGRRVLAKTTGAEPSVVTPDGRVHPIQRHGAASILEQKLCVREAHQLGADCVVAELMSIHRENHVVESQKLLRPQVVVVTNVGLDHTDAMGDTRDEVASVLAECLTPGSDVFVPETERLEPLEAMARRRGARIHAVPSPPEGAEPSRRHARLHFSRNVELVRAVAEHLGAEGEAISRGLAAAQLDVGQLGIWRCPLVSPGSATESSGHLFAINAFAANDPRSTREAMDKALSILPSVSRVVGLVSLRSDRADRTLQWVAALQDEAREWFDRLFFVGRHALAARRALGWGEVVGSSSPRTVMTSVAAEMADGDVLVGLGNLGGVGRSLVELWRQEGEAYGP